MKRIDALMVLEAKVVVGELPHVSVIRIAFPVVDLGIRDDCAQVGRAFHGSLDAAKALQDAVLPDMIYTIKNSHVEIWKHRKLHDGSSLHNPSRAWLIAIIRGLIAMEQDK